MIIFFKQGNLLLEDTIERYYYELEWAEEGLGLFLVRGENVVLLGELVPHKPIISKYILFSGQDEDEFRTVTRKMSKFKRPLESFLPRYRAWRAEEVAKRKAETAAGINDVSPLDYY